MNAIPEIEKKQATPEAAAPVEAGLRERLESQPEAVKTELVVEAANDVASFETEGAELKSRVEASAGPLDAETAAAVADTETEAKAAAAELKREIGVEKKEAEPMTRTVEYRDSEGRVIGKATAVLEQAITELSLGGEQYQMQRLVSLRFTGDHGEMDILDLVNKTGAEVYLNAPDEHKRYNAHTPEGNKVTAHGIENLSQVATLLHELGHAEQNQDGPYAEISSDYANAKVMRRLGTPDVEGAGKIIEKLLTSFPELERSLGDTYRQDRIAYDEAVRRRQDIMVTFRDLVKKAEPLEAAGDKLGLLQLKVEFLTAQGERAKAELEKMELESKMRKLAYLTVQVLETDASNRAYKWMKEIKQRTGADLLSKHFSTTRDAGYQEDSDADAKPDDSDDILSIEEINAEIETDAVSTLKRFLSTYDVDIAAAEFAEAKLRQETKVA